MAALVRRWPAAPRRLLPGRLCLLLSAGRLLPVGIVEPLAGAALAVAHAVPGDSVSRLRPDGAHRGPVAPLYGEN